MSQVRSVVHGVIVSLCSTYLLALLTTPEWEAKADKELHAPYTLKRYPWKAYYTRVGGDGLDFPARGEAEVQTCGTVEGLKGRRRAGDINN